MSYLFSEANKDATAGGGGRSAASDDNLSVRAQVILTWMLLVELLRKKVDEVRMYSYSSSIQHAGRVVWLGILVYFFNMTSPGQKAVLSFLWILCAVKLLQRIVFTELEKRSYPNSKSWLISSYMPEMLMVEREPEWQRRRFGFEQTSFDGDELLERCHYIVMGEEKLVVREVTADGYKLNIINNNSGIITVGKVWRLLPLHHQTYLEFGDIRRVCLSFALFKLLRRRFEHLPPMTAEEADNCRVLLSRGFDGEVDGGALFSVMAVEVKLLREYYHSVVPVVLASPLFILVNYFLVPVVVLILCLIAVVVCGNGDMSHALRSISADNYALQPGFAKLTICVLVRAGHSRPAFFFTLDLFVTLTLFLIFWSEEIREFITVLFSNWFIVSMLCNYVKTNKTVIRGAFRWILWVRRRMSKYTNMRLRQFSLLFNHRGPRLIAALVPGTLYLNVKTVPMVTDNLKLAIETCLLRSGDGDGDADPLELGRACRRHHCHIILSWAYESESFTEVILTWHIATCLLEDRFHRSEPAAATVRLLSRYCAYLVVFHPELLPDRRAKAELVLKQAKEELRNLLGFWGYYLSSPRARAQKLFDSIGPAEEDGVVQSPQKDHGVVHRGIRLAEQLKEVFRSPRDNGWEILSDVWTELLVYAAAPATASDEERVKAHADILAEGVELITVLWAFAMHTGMERQRRRSTQDLELI